MYWGANISLFDESGLTAMLIDNYLNTKFSIHLSDITAIDFVVKENSVSYAGRFTLIFDRSNVDTRSGNTIFASVKYGEKTKQFLPHL